MHFKLKNVFINASHVLVFERIVQIVVLIGLTSLIVIAH